MPPVNERDRIDRYNAIIHHLSSSLRHDHNSLHALAAQCFDAHKRAHNSGDYRAYRYSDRRVRYYRGFRQRVVNGILPYIRMLYDAKREPGYASHKMGLVSTDALAFYLYVQLQVHDSIPFECRSLSNGLFRAQPCRDN
ncbi:unnamed protein product [Lasius platythorax]|uniref:Uncharacterized protein n=1 Tax=Lasius platythorax TaxID=488582 RepID=A0AAV2P823_9HYME